MIWRRLYRASNHVDASAYRCTGRCILPRLGPTRWKGTAHNTEAHLPPSVYDGLLSGLTRPLAWAGALDLSRGLENSHLPVPLLYKPVPPPARTACIDNSLPVLQRRNVPLSGFDRNAEDIGDMYRANVTARRKLRKEPFLSNAALSVGIRDRQEPCGISRCAPVGLS